MFYKSVKKRGLLLLYLLLSVIVLLAQKNQYVIKNYTSENGLPQNSVKSIKFDRNGFAWLATEGGLVRFDNRNFKTYGTNVLTGITSERIVAMMADTAGNIWAQNTDYQNIKIREISSRYLFISEKADSSRYSFVATGYLTESPVADSLWQAINDRKTIPVVKALGGLRNGDIYLFLGNEAFWISNNKVTSLKPYDEEPIGSLVVDDDYYLQIWSGNKIQLWYNGEVIAEKIEGDIVRNKDYLFGNFKTMWSEGGAFIYAGNSLYRLVIQGGKVQSILVISNLDIELPLCIAYRADVNTYYIGTGTQGLYTVKISDFIYADIPKESGAQNYYTIAKTSTDNIIVRDAIVRPDNRAAYAPLHNSNSRATYTDVEDRVYYESEFELFRYNSLSGKVENLLQLDNRLLAIIPDRTGANLLLCSHSSITAITQEGNIIWQNKIPQNLLATGLEQWDEKLYLLSTSRGLKWYDLDANRITQSILDSFYIRTIYKDKQDRIWIGTDGNGSFLYTRNKLYSLPAGPREAFRSIHAFIEDKKERFWLPTNNGLYNVPVNALAERSMQKSNSVFWFTFNKTNGLRTNEFNGGANPNFQWLQDGALLLASMNGLVKFYPDKMVATYPKERIFVDDIFVDGQLLIQDSKSGVLKLKPTFQTLSLVVTCPYFGNNENLKLEYRIGKGNSSWLPVPESGIISINTLPAGEYTLVVQKVGEDSNTLNKSIVLPVIVAPFFYNTGWFLLVVILLFIGLFYFYARRRVIKLEKEKSKIEGIVDTRTQELSAAIQQLENSEAALRKSNDVKEQIIATVLHDLRSPIFSMRLISKELVKSWDNKEDNLSKVRRLDHSIAELNRFTDQFFSWATSQQDHFKIEKTMFPLQEVFEEIEKLYKEIILVNGNMFIIENTAIQLYTDKQVLLLIIRNLVDNANKNTTDGRIHLRAEQLPAYIQIQVSDTGKGLNAFQIENFVNRDKAVKNGRLGSVIILEMLDKINGRLMVHSEQGKGATFTIQLP